MLFIYPFYRYLCTQTPVFSHIYICVYSPIYIHVCSHAMSEIQHKQPLLGGDFPSLLSFEYIMSPFMQFSNSKDGSGRRKASVPVLVFFQSCNVFILLRSQ